MQRYIAIRLAQSLFALWGMSIIVFGLARITGDPMDVILPLEATAEHRQQITEQWGLDRPLPVQYVTFLGNALRGDFGDSLKYQGQSAMGLVGQRLPATLQLASFSLIISVAIALPLGVLSAVKRDTPLDYIGKIIALLGQSMPTFWLGVMLMWIFAVHFKLFPVYGSGGLRHMILPAIALGWFQVAALMRLVRSSMLDILDSEFVKLARIKGIPEWKVIWKHCLRNAAIAPLTYFGIIAAALMTGAVVIESVFSWPGTGLLAVDSIRARDYQVIQAVVIVFSTIFITANLVVDILYAYLDPRIHLR